MWISPRLLRGALAVLGLTGFVEAELGDLGFWADPSPRREIGLGISHQTLSTGIHAQALFFRFEGWNASVPRIDFSYRLHTLTWDETVETPFDFLAHEVLAGVEFRYGRILRTRIEGGVRIERSGASTLLRGQAAWAQSVDVKAWRLGFMLRQDDHAPLGVTAPWPSLLVEHAPLSWLSFRGALRYFPGWTVSNFQSGEMEGAVELFWSLGPQFKIKTGLTVRSEPDVMAEVEGRFENRGNPRAPILTLGASWGPVGEVRAGASVEFRLLRKAAEKPVPVAVAAVLPELPATNPGNTVGKTLPSRILAAPLFNASSEPEFDYLSDLYAQLIENRLGPRIGTNRLNADDGARNLVLFFKHRDLPGPDAKIAEILADQYEIQWLLLSKLLKKGAYYVVELRAHRLRPALLKSALIRVDPKNRENLTRDSDMLLDLILPLDP
jgi:hypothetical protein